MKRRRYNVEVLVGTFPEKSLRQIKKKMEREGVVRDIKRIAYFESPTQSRRKKLMRAIKTNVLKNHEYINLKRLSR